MDVREKLIDIVSSAVGRNASDVHGSHDLMGLGLDSLGLFEVVVQVEKDFEIELEDRLLNEITTVDDLIVAVTDRVRLHTAE